jgi:REP element-mobilizing transposase RayT
MDDTRDKRGNASNLRRGRISLPNHVYHITKCAHRGFLEHGGLASDASATVIIEAILHQHTHHRCHAFAFVVMPDHFHWLFALPECTTVHERMKVLCGWCSQEIRRLSGARESVWQDGFFDHAVRKEEAVTDVCAYIEYNPVRKGLCDGTVDWPWSSANPRWRERMAPHPL